MSNNTNNKLTPMTQLNLTEEKTITEANIRDFLYDHPEILGDAIGVKNLQPLQREKRQFSGGRIDLLFGDDENNRYEVELQLGATDETHIIRSIEYWDIERKRYPKYDHVAVLIAENITGRFFNVISLFHGAIPLIALQLTAIPLPDNKVGLNLTNILDLTVSSADDDTEQELVTNRAWWEQRSNSTMMTLMDNIFKEINPLCQEFELNYNKFYIGLKKDGIAKNFISFVPQKGNVQLRIHCDENNEIEELLSSKHIDIERKYRQYYQIAFSTIKSFNESKEEILKLITSAKNKRGV